MVHYTPLSIEEIFPSTENHYKVVSYRGKTVLAQHTEDQQLQLMQLLSTDPQDYLEQSFTPGNIMKNDYIQEEK